MSKVTLWRTYWDHQDVKIGSFEAEEKDKTYRRCERGDKISNYSTVIYKIDIGRIYFFTAEESIAGFIAECQRVIDARLADIEREQMRQGMARELLNDSR